MWQARVLTIVGAVSIALAQAPADWKAMDGVFATVLKASRDPIGQLTPDVLAKGD